MDDFFIDVLYDTRESEESEGKGRSTVIVPRMKLITTLVKNWVMMTIRTKSMGSL